MQDEELWRSKPFRKVDFTEPRAELVADGESMLLRNAIPLPDCVRRVTDWLTQAANSHAERIFLGERLGSGWRELTYADVAHWVDETAQALIDRQIGRGSVVAAISPNSIAMAVLQLAAISLGAAFAPISPNYAQGRQSYELLKDIFALLDPALTYVSDLSRFGEGVGRAAYPLEKIIEGERGIRSDLAASPAESLATARKAVTSDDAAKILLTSGSTGHPKAVINTHRMIASNQAAISAMWPFLSRRPPITACWLPWNHTMGGNFTLFMMLANGGTFYIDDGRPTPEGIERTVGNLVSVKPTIHFNVPRGLDMLLPYLNRAEVSEAFFDRLDAICYSGAPLPAATWSRLNGAAVRATGRRVHIVTSWGATETGPCITLSGSDSPDPSFVGLPLLGVTVKLAKVDHLTEGRVYGPNVMPGYLRNPEATARAFDEDNYYRTGDAIRLLRDGDRILGLSFEGRVVENFKLATGTWVEVGTLRVKVLTATAPILQDCVIAGEGRDELGLIAFLNLSALRQLVPDISDEKAAASDPRVKALIQSRLKSFNENNSASSLAIRRVRVETTPLNAEDGEIADKGYVNQRAVLRRRASAVEILFSEDASVIRI